ncbi:hypothetical protein [Salinicoccus halitifaciens]|uniref:Uncharacterized protein n=1 Tax=Salinicoccus halitifaciens TaxID=1073415 RepID=A0ABV2E5V8_9STAP|nr:hypothetical protein [Salinicoccus halitifaciens]MCD2137155.1 hypothetical protein [Salinicoccus halitifaciens]
MNREEIINKFDEKIKSGNEDAETTEDVESSENNHEAGQKLLDRILEEIEDYKKSLEGKDIDLHINSGGEDDMETSINISGLKENVVISYTGSVDALEVSVRNERFILPLDRYTEDEVYVVEGTWEINSMGYAEFADMVMVKMLGEEYIHNE